MTIWFRFHRFLVCASVGLSLCIGPVTISVATANEADLKAQRALFLSAEKAYKKKQSKTYRGLKAQLTDYPLYPYLAYKELKTNLQSAKPQQISDFLESYPNSPLTERLRGEWLSRLAKRGAWRNYLKFDVASSSSKRRCNTGLALYHTGNKEAAFKAAQNLWLVAKSQVKTCDPLFKVWENAGGITNELVWQRIRLAIEKKQADLAAFLVKRLPKHQRALGLAWVAVHKNPSKVTQLKVLRKDSAPSRDILTHGLIRYSYRDLDKMIKAWTGLTKTHRFNQDQRARVESTIALRLMRKNREGAAQRLKKVPLAKGGDEAFENVFRVSLRYQDWPMILTWIAALPERERGSDRWRYWRARGMENTGKVHEARKFYAGLSLTRGYYSFHAADRIGVSYTLDDAPVLVSPAVADSLERSDNVRSALELMAINRKTDARREWRSLVKRLDRVQLKAAAKFAQHQKWHNLAIMTVAKSGHYDDLELRFPLAYRSLVSRHSGSSDLDMAWVYALMRQESAFRPEARSSVGARGLMQLMPATAKYVARKTRTRYRKVAQLYDPGLNIRLGTSYLRIVLDDLNNNPVLATAAYNAGPHRVKKWLPPDQTMPADAWVELIPFDETRKYVKRIMEYTVVYEQRIGLTPTRLAERMPEIGTPVPINAPHRAGKEVRLTKARET